MNLWEILGGIFSRCSLGAHRWEYQAPRNDPDDESGYSRLPREFCSRCYSWRFVKARK